MKAKLSKKYFFVMAIFLVASFMLSGQVFASETEAQVTAPATVNTGALNVRSGPGIEYGTVDVVYQGQTVTMLGRNADASWIYIRTPNNVDGWVNINYLSFTINPFDLPTIGTQPPTFPTATSTPQAVNPIAIYGVVNTGALNVRSGPSPQFSRVDTVYFGDTIFLSGRNADGSWVFGTTPNNINGWMNSRYLTLTSPVSMLPVIDNSVPTVPITPIATVPGVTPVPTAIPTNTAVVTSGSLNVRAGAGVGYSRVTVLSNADLVLLVGRNLDSTWLLISNYSGQQGWVNAKYLATTTNVATLPVASHTGTGHVLAGNLNLRSAAGPGNSVVTVAPYGSSLVLIGRTSDNAWLYVRAGNGKEGWSNRAYITTSLDVNQLPVLAGPVPGQPTQPIQPIAPTNPGNTASIRSCPNVACPATGTVYSGLTVTATGRTADNTWVYVVLSNGAQGWIQSQYVVLGVPINSLPVVTASPTG